ncbi:MAG: hypothetical protein EHM79_00815 [Geobacter sp.]|nr:MAG: hypothetical protein EHM79_00815 [Geobacter sp.]
MDKFPKNVKILPTKAQFIFKTSFAEARKGNMTVEESMNIAWASVLKLYKMGKKNWRRI